MSIINIPIFIAILVGSSIFTNLVLEKAFILSTLLLPKKIRNKYQKTTYYEYLCDKNKGLLKSKLLTDNIKIKLLSKKVVKTLSEEDIIDISNHFKHDNNRLAFLLNKKIFKKSYNDKKIIFSDKSYYEKLYELLLEEDKVNYLIHVDDDKFVLEKLKSLKKISLSSKVNIIKSLKSDLNKVSLLTIVDSTYYICSILKTVNDKNLVCDYIDKLTPFYKKMIFSDMKEEDLKLFLSKGQFIEYILMYIKDEKVFANYFNYISFNDKEQVAKCGLCYNEIFKFYIQNKKLFSQKVSLEIVLNILKNTDDEALKRKCAEQVEDETFKKIILSNTKEEIEKASSNDVTRYNIAKNNITFGVELESSYENKDLLLSMNKMLGNWKIKSDGSIANGVEIVSPILSYDKNSLSCLKYICDFMENNGFVATKECGGHIHVGFDFFQSEKELMMLYIIYTNTQDIFFDICNHKGSNKRPGIDRYARPISSKLILAITSGKFKCVKNLKSFVKIMQEIQSERYFDINISNALLCKRKNTIEFRFPNGEINYEEVLLNITLIIKLLLACKKYAYINEYDEKYTPIKLLQSDLSKDSRKNVLFKILFEDDETLNNLYNERYESNKNVDVMKRKYIIKW